MTVKYENKIVDVVNSTCINLPCFQLGFDKGTFVQGRGYTKYYKTEKAVCMTRHLHGCPVTQKCNNCNTVYGPAIQKICPKCKISLNSLVGL